jgi:hypothetical protein
MLRAGVNPSKLPFQVFATDILLEGVGWIEVVCQVRKSSLKRRSFFPSAAASVSANDIDENVPTAESISLEPSSLGALDAASSSHPFGQPESLNYPKIEIFSPDGKFIGQRPCLGAWELWQQGKKQEMKRTGRPRKPMSGTKKREKTVRRSASAAAA